MIETARVPLERSLIDARVLRICAWSVALALAIGFVAQALFGIIGLVTNIAFYGRFSTAFVSPAQNHRGWLVLFSRIPARVTILKPLSAAISIGTGGPFGAEGPIIATGGALGSLVGQIFTVTATERKTLLAAGAAAGMAATFGSPVSAVLLAIELLLFEFRPRRSFRSRWRASPRPPFACCTSAPIRFLRCRCWRGRAVKPTPRTRSLARSSAGSRST